MDHAVGLVQAYLHLNGYFTVTEFPVLEALGREVRASTDLDVLAVRFPGAGRLAPVGRRPPRWPVPDAALDTPAEGIDMLIAEVKEGRAELNQGATQPRVLAAALTRFGCCAPEAVPEVVERLLRHGRAQTHHGHLVRLLAFGSSPPTRPAKGFSVVPLERVVAFLQGYLAENWEAVRHAQFKDEALGLLSILQKTRPR